MCPRQKVNIKQKLTETVKTWITILQQKKKKMITTMQLTFKNNQEINTLGKFWGTSIQYYYEMCKNWHLCLLMNV